MSLNDYLSPSLRSRSNEDQGVRTLRQDLDSADRQARRQAPWLSASLRGRQQHRSVLVLVPVAGGLRGIQGDGGQGSRMPGGLQVRRGDPLLSQLRADFLSAVV